MDKWKSEYPYKNINKCLDIVGLILVMALIIIKNIV